MSCPASGAGSRILAVGPAYKGHTDWSIYMAWELNCAYLAPQVLCWALFVCLYCAFACCR